MSMATGTGTGNAPMGDAGAPAGAAQPPALKTLGKVSLGVGFLVTLLNLWLAESAVDELAHAGITDGPVAVLRVQDVVFVVIGGLLMAGGLGLVLGRRWGRTVSLVAAGSTFFGVLVAASVPRILENMPLDHPVREIHLHTGAPALTPLYGILLLVMLNSADARRWASRGVAGALATVAERTSGMAVASFALSLVPFAGVTQLVGLILGIVALSQIRAAEGKLGGRGFAIAGVAIASTILIFLLGILVLVVGSSSSSRH